MAESEYLNTEKFVNNSVFVNKLSSSLKDDERSIFANVNRNQWISRDGNVVHFVRLEFKLFKGENSKPMSISLTVSQFEWLLDCIESNAGSKMIEMDREDKYLCYEIPEKIFGSFVVSIIEQKSKYGILFDVTEKAIFKVDGRLLIFIMKYQNAVGNKLYEIARFLYSASIKKVIKDFATIDCEGCCDESLVESSHACKRNPDKIIADYFDKALIEEEVLKSHYLNLFEHFAKLLNINEFNRSSAENILLTIVKGDTENLKLSVKLLMDNPDKSNAKAISRIIELKEEIEKAGNGLQNESVVPTGPGGYHNSTEPYAKRVKF